MEDTPLIEETLLKRRRSLEELQHRRAVTVQQQVKRKRVVRGDNVKIIRPERFVHEYRIKEGSQQKMVRKKRHVENNTGKKNKEMKNEIIKTSSIGLVIRIHEARHASKDIKKALSSLKLYKKYDARFIALDDLSIPKLVPLNAFLAYGFISYKNVLELLKRRAYIQTTEKSTTSNNNKTNNKKSIDTKMPLNDNMILETRYGSKGIFCINDLGHEIYNIGNHFDEIISSINTFELANPISNFEIKYLDMHDTVEGAGGGYLKKDEINQLLERIL